MKCRGAVLCTAMIALAGCGGEQDAGWDPQALTDSAASADRQGPFLRSLPDACDALPESLARELLQADVTRRPPAGDECSYLGAGGKSAGLRMFMQSLQVMDSGKESLEELQEKAGYLANGQSPVAVLEDVGNIGFVFDYEDTTSLLTLTGIGGTAVISDRIVAEVSVSYRLSDPEQSYESRLKSLESLAKAHLKQLHDLATSDRSSP